MSGEAAQTRSLTVTVRNRPGVLARVVSQFARRGLNIDSLVATPVGAGSAASLAIAFTADEQSAARIAACLLRLVDVLRVDP